MRLQVWPAVLPPHGHWLHPWHAQVEAREALVDVLRAVFALHGAVPMGAPRPDPMVAATHGAQVGKQSLAAQQRMDGPTMQAAASWASGCPALRATRPRCWRPRARAWPRGMTTAARLPPGWPSGLRAGTFRRWTACGGMRWAALASLLLRSALAGMQSPSCSRTWPSRVLLMAWRAGRVCVQEIVMRASSQEEAWYARSSGGDVRSLL